MANDLWAYLSIFSPASVRTNFFPNRLNSGVSSEKKANLKDLRVTISGTVDPSTAMGLESDNRAGFLAMEAKIELESDLSPDDQDRFEKELLERCVLCDTIKNPTDLKCAIAFHRT